MAQAGDRFLSSRSTSVRRNRILTLVVLAVLLVGTLAGLDMLILSRTNLAQAFSPHYYMALGDSLSFGYQPNFDFSAGFADVIYNDLHPAGVTAAVNYACAGETTETMIHGGCPGRFAHHGSYTGAQLQAAVDFLKDARHQGRVSPITLEIGSNDVIADWDPSTCSIASGSNVEADLATMDANLTQIILPQLVAALGNHTKANNGDLHLLNYYNPYAKECPDSGAFVHELNDHLAADAAKFRIPVVDIYSAFGGDAHMADYICTYTWMCDPRFHDIHPTNDGYKLIAKTVEVALGLPGTGLLPGIIPPWNFLPPLGAMPDQLASSGRRLVAARAA